MTKVKIGAKAVVTRATHVGVETILGHVVTPMVLTETGEVTHVTIEGHVTHFRITGLPLPIEEEHEVRLEMIPLAPRHPHLLRVEIL